MPVAKKHIRRKNTRRRKQVKKRTRRAKHYRGGYTISPNQVKQDITTVLESQREEHKEEIRKILRDRLYEVLEHGDTSWTLSSSELPNIDENSRIAVNNILNNLYELYINDTTLEDMNDVYTWLQSL